MTALTVCGLGGCAKPSATDGSPLATGRQVYLANCSSCHNRDPNLDGVLGPPVAGASRELLEARILRQSYPPGYQPKRATHLMRTLPWLAPQLDDLTAFLHEAQKNPK